jgi:hypothetical protein
MFMETMVLLIEILSFKLFSFALACFIANYDDTYVAGVADGVGGWRRHGVDPSLFSSQLMANCAEIVRSGEFELTRPDLIIAQAYNKLKTAPRPIGFSDLPSNLTFISYF